MYPVMLRLHNRRCVIVGGGQVAARKVPALLAAGALLTAISPAFDALFNSMPEHQVNLIRSIYQPGLLADLRPFLVCCATDDPAVNEQAATEAHTLGALVDRADEADASDWHTMAVVQRGDLILAASTGGASPALTRHARQRLETAFGEEYTQFSAWLRMLRPRLRERISTQAERATIWKTLIDSDVLTYLKQGDEPMARALVHQITGEEL